MEPLEGVINAGLTRTHQTYVSGEDREVTTTQNNATTTQEEKFLAAGDSLGVDKYTGKGAEKSGSSSNSIRESKTPTGAIVVVSPESAGPSSPETDPRHKKESEDERKRKQQQQTMQAKPGTGGTKDPTPDEVFGKDSLAHHSKSAEKLKAQIAQAKSFLKAQSVDAQHSP